jgi:cyclophilin family peptidyl-prolyl cis-trans isomerase
MLTAGDPVKNARALLRNALPINNPPLRTIQSNLEGISEQLRIPGSKALGPIARAVGKATGTLVAERARISAAFAPDKKAAGDAALDKLADALKAFNAVLEAKDKQGIPAAQNAALAQVTAAEEALVKGFPFEVPAKYADLPQLKGRATLEMKVSLRTARQDGVKGGVMTMVADGFNAPLTAGNFVDLAAKKFYDGMEVQRADGFVVQTGDPGTPSGGYEEGGRPRTIPFEVMVRGEKAPVYEDTLEDLGRPNAQPAIPFNAYGTAALARSEFEANSGSSQIFWLLKESELTPSGANLLDGRYAVFGYIVDGAELLADMQVGDRIDYIKVTEGLQNLQPGARKGGAAAAAVADAAPEAAAAVVAE